MSDSVIVTSNGFPDPETLPLVSDIQFREPYSSAAINRKLRGLALPGIYAGFTPSPGTGLNLLISSDTAGGTCSFDLGTYYQLSARQQADVTLEMTADSATLVALQVTYALGTETSQVNSASNIQAVEFVLLDTTATLADNQLEMCKVTIPAGTTQITSDMIDLSGRIARSLSFELSSAIDSSSEEVAANSLAVKSAISFIENEIATAVSTNDLTVSGAASLLSTLAVTGAVSIGNTLTVSGPVAFAGTLTLGAGLNVTGPSTLVNDSEVLVIKPTTADAAYFIRAQKYDGTNHWYLGQGAASQDNVYFTNYLGSNNIALLSTGVIAMTGTVSVSAGMSVAGGITCGAAKYPTDGNVYGATFNGYLYQFLNGKFVTAVRLGTASWKAVWQAAGWSDTAGYVLTAVTNANQDDVIDSAYGRPLQYCINGSWYTAASV